MCRRRRRCESLTRTKYVNTYSYDFGASARVDLRVIGPRYIDIGRLYELTNVKKKSLHGLEVKILNVHVFAHKHSQFY